MRRGEWEEGHSEAFERAEPGLKPKSQATIQRFCLVAGIKLLYFRFLIYLLLLGWLQL